MLLCAPTPSSIKGATISPLVPAPVPQTRVETGPQRATAVNRRKIRQQAFALLTA